MRTDAKIGLVAVLILVVLVIIYFAFHNSSRQTVVNNALPSAQPALVETPTLPGSSMVPPAQTAPSQTQPGLISLPATSMPAATPGTTPGLSDQTANSTATPAMPTTTAALPTAGSAAPFTAASGNSNAAPALNTSNTPIAETGNTAGNSGIGSNANSNATLNLPAVNVGSQNQSGSLGSSGVTAHKRHHRSRTLTLSAPRSGSTRHGGVYIVRKGDTLAGISQRIYGNERMIRALERANPGLDPRRMRIGQKIHLPRRGALASTSRHYAARHRAGASTRRGERTYVVRAGEDLSGISRKFYHTPALWKKIYDANRRIIGPSPRDLRAGERIVIPAR
ncbi:MAG: LysM peptidoglycan-binding domain-containing protein [Phycisphaerae bacterium]